MKDYSASRGGEVLRIAKLGPGREQYYLQAVGLEPPGEWLGRGPESAGLVGPVGGAELTALLSGRDPRSDQVLGSARNRVRVTGFDLTLAAPKSVSLLGGIADEPVAEAVYEGHRAAVEAAMGYVEERALGVRRSYGTERTVEPVDGAFGAAFLHRTSRALDPHLHSHVVVANLAKGPDGRYSALDGRGIYAHAGAVGALYHAQLRVELRERLGVEWGPLDRGRADLVGIGPEVRRAFSRRSTAIANDLAESGMQGHRAKELASLKTRQPKDLAVGAEELRGEWRRRAADLGLGAVRLDAVLEREGPSRTPRTASDEIGQDPERVVVRLATAGRPVARRHVVQAWCMELRGGAQATSVERASDRLLDAISTHEPSRGGPGVTERRMPLESLDLGALGERFADMASERRRTLERQRSLGLGPERGAGRGRAMNRGDVLGREIRMGQDTGLGLG
jgi:conjugative relaxase-like TrwC/TraI family protein